MYTPYKGHDLYLKMAIFKTVALFIISTKIYRILICTYNSPLFL